MKNKKIIPVMTGMAKGVLWLSVAGIVVKLLGLLYKIPLTNMIGDSGMGYFGSAYTVYSFFYTVSTAGLPVALSIAVSSALAAGNGRLASRTFTLCLALFTALGTVMSLGMLFGARGLSSLVSNRDAATAIAALSPTLTFVCVIGAYRGFFQGRGSMAPTAVSQVIESAGKLLFGIILACLAKGRGYSAPVVAAYAVFGITLSEGIAMIYLVISKGFAKKISQLPEADRGQSISNLGIVKNVLKLALPISIGSSVMSLSGLLDLAVVMKRLQQIGFTPELSNAMFGNYTSLALPMFNMPSVLIAPVSAALVPFIASAVSAGRRQEAVGRALSCLKYTTLIALPCSLGMSALAEPILSLIFNAEMAREAAPCLSVLSFAIVFVAYSNVCIAIMQATGHTLLPIIVMSVGSAVKLVGAWLLIGRYAMLGTPLSTVICYAAMSIICFAYLDRRLGIRVSFLKMTLLPFLGSALCALCASLFYQLMVIRIGNLACLAGIALGAAVYFLFLLSTGYINWYELQSLPIIGRVINKLKGIPKNGYQRKNRGSGQ